MVFGAGVFDRGYALVHENEMDIPATLKQIAQVAGVNQEGLAAIIGVKQPTISRLMKGAEPKQTTYENIREAAIRYGVASEADVRSDDVATALDRTPGRTLKVKGYVGAGGVAHYYAVSEGDLGEVPASDNDPASAVAVEIMGTSLGRFFDRWYAVYDDVRAPVTDDLIGQLCVVGLDDDRVLIKKIRRSGKRFDLISNDPAEEPILGVKIAWAAKVTSIRQK